MNNSILHRVKRKLKPRTRIRAFIHPGSSFITNNNQPQQTITSNDVLIPIFFDAFKVYLNELKQRINNPLDYLNSCKESFETDTYVELKKTYNQISKPYGFTDSQRQIFNTFDEKEIQFMRFLGFMVNPEGFEYLIPKEEVVSYDVDTSKINILVTGTQFRNDGAKSMLYRIISEVRLRFENAIIWYLPCEPLRDPESLFPNVYTKENIARYKMNFLLDGMDYDSTLYKIAPYLDGIIDASGYTLASNWKPFRYRYLNILYLSYLYDIPTYLMPQSFGPCDFDETLNNAFKELLSHCKIIYAREEDGYKCLTQTYGLTNVEMANDIVLDKNELNLDAIFTKKEEIKIPRITTDNNVAIIPNERNYEFGDKEFVLGTYTTIINKLIEQGNDVYIFPHCAYSRDFKVCDEIYELFKDNEKVHRLTDTIDVLEYSKFIHNFKFVIASRFHSIVHSYKQFVPAITLGWAVKYNDLSKKFKQEDYVFNVQDNNFDNLIAMIDKMNANYKQESNTIKEIYNNQPESTTFDVINNIDFYKKNKRYQEIDINNNYFEKFLKYSFSDNKYNSQEQMRGIILRFTHIVEKGLSYEDYRPGFGEPNILKFIEALEEYVKHFSKNEIYYKNAICSLYKYVNKNKEYGYINEEIESRIYNIDKDYPECDENVGSFKFKPNNDGTDIKYIDVVRNRHSARFYKDSDVDINLIKDAIRLSSHTPSACNRQPWSVNIISDKDKLKDVLANHNGTRGFGEGINKLLLVTCDMRYYNSSREVFAPFVDGGMYVMSLVNNLYYKGIASVVLSAALTPTQEANVRHILNIKDEQVFIAFIGIGNQLEETSTSKSYRLESKIIIN